MRVTVDTNLVVSAFLWGGNSRRVLDAAQTGVIDLFTSHDLLAELDEVLSRARFRWRLDAVNSSVGDILDQYKALAELIEVVEIGRVVMRDPDDDAVIACAVSGECEFIVSGDKDLLDLKIYRNIRIVTATELLSELGL
ncbi:MAG: putative toxin-antitoxin system toxin component, PIN family [Pyrinomonadaceae bacterium]